MSNVILLHPRTRPTHTPAHTLRADCERLMRRLVKDGRTPRRELQVLADVLDHIITRVEAQSKE